MKNLKEGCEFKIHPHDGRMFEQNVCVVRAITEL